MNQQEIRQKRLAALERASQSTPHPLSGPEHICIEKPLHPSTNGASSFSSSQPDIVTVETTSTYNTPSSDAPPCSGARSRAPPSASSTSGPSRSSEPSYTSRGSRGPHSASSASAPSRGGITTLSDLPSSRDGGSCKTRVSSRTVTQTQNLELYVRLPSRQITSEQLEQLVRVRYGVEIRVRHMNTKFQVIEIFIVISNPAPIFLNWIRPNCKGIYKKNIERLYRKI